MTVDLPKHVFKHKKTVKTAVLLEQQRKKLTYSVSSQHYDIMFSASTLVNFITFIFQAKKREFCLPIFHRQTKMAIDDSSCTQCFDHAAKFLFEVTQSPLTFMLLLSLYKTKSQLGNSFYTQYSRCYIFVLIEKFESVGMGLRCILHIKYI